MEGLARKMFSRTTRYSLIAVCLLALLLSGCGANTSDAQATSSGKGPKVRLVLTDDTLDVSETGDVEIHLDDVDNLYGMHLSLKFDPTTLRVQDADPAQQGIQIEPGLLPAPDFAVRNVADNDQGTIEYAVIQLYPREPATGSGVVATIRFQAVGKGESPLTFLQATLSDPDGQELPVQLAAAKFSVD
jgi:hypothetical protein